MAKYGAPYKMKGDPIKRNFDISSVKFKDSPAKSWEKPHHEHHQLGGYKPKYIDHRHDIHHPKKTTKTFKKKDQGYTLNQSY